MNVKSMCLSSELDLVTVRKDDISTLQILCNGKQVPQLLRIKVSGNEAGARLRWLRRKWSGLKVTRSWERGKKGCIIKEYIYRYSLINGRVWAKVEQYFSSEFLRAVWTPGNHPRCLVYSRDQKSSVPYPVSLKCQTTECYQGRWGSLWLWKPFRVSPFEKGKKKKKDYSAFFAYS